MFYTFILWCTKLNEGSRWIKLPVINMTMQTSDLAKLALFMYLSRQLSRKQNVIKDFKKGFLPIVIPVVIICALIAPANLSTALLVGATSFMLMFIGRVNTKHFCFTIGIAMIPVVFLFALAVSTYDKANISKKNSRQYFRGPYENMDRPYTNFHVQQKRR
jgi:cell division protein FtsW